MATPNQAGAAILSAVDLAGPRTKPPAPPSAFGPTRSQETLMDVSVLVVDDDPGSAKLLGVVLRSEGCVVRLAASAEDALAILAAGFCPRAVLLDLVLPLMSGLLFAERLRADPSMRDVVIIAITAFNGPEAERVALAAGCTAYVRKPIDALRFPEFLLTQLRSAR
jgi:CheY-like chemotaxis protein